MEGKARNYLLAEGRKTRLGHAVGILGKEKFVNSLFSKATVGSEMVGKEHFKSRVHGILRLFIIWAILKGFVHTVVHRADAVLPQSR